MSTTHLSITKSHITDVNHLVKAPETRHLTSLDISECKALTDVSGLACLTNLTTLKIRYCGALKRIDALANLTRLTTLSLYDCTSLEDIGPLLELRNLKTLDLRCCEALTHVDGIGCLTNLTDLKLDGCPGLEPALQQNWKGAALRKLLAKLRPDGLPKTPPATGSTHTRASRAARSKLRKMLKSRDREVFLLGCLSLETLAQDTASRVVVEELASGTGVDDGGWLTVGDEVKKRTRAARRFELALWVLRLPGLRDFRRQELMELKVPDVDFVG